MINPVTLNITNNSNYLSKLRVTPVHKAKLKCHVNCNTVTTTKLFQRTCSRNMLARWNMVHEVYPIVSTYTNLSHFSQHQMRNVLELSVRGPKT